MRNGVIKNVFIKIINTINVIVFVLFLLFAFNEKLLLFSLFGKTFGVSFYISLIGLPLFIIELIFTKPRRDKLFYKTIVPLLFLFAVLATTSFAMSVFYYHDFNGLFNTNPIKHLFLNIVKYSYDVLVIFYCLFYISSAFKIKHKAIFIDLYILGFLIIGLFQFVILITKNNSLLTIYDKIDFLKILQSKEILSKLMLNYNFPRISGYADEPGHNGIILFCFVFPYLFIQLFREKQSRYKWHYIKYLSLLFLCTVFAIFSFSSAIYLGLIIELCIFLSYFYQKTTINRKVKIILSCSLACFFLIMFVIPQIRNGIFSSIVKIMDTSDYSAMYHYSTTYNDLVIFIKHPLFGVGDGNQGYFYFENIIGTAFGMSPESQNSLTGKNGLLDGGCFVFSALSGFGAFGIALLVVFLIGFFKKSYYVFKRRDIIHMAYNSCLIMLLIFLMFRSGIHRNYGAFISFSLVSVLGENDYAYYKKWHRDDVIFCNINI